MYFGSNGCIKYYEIEAKKRFDYIFRNFGRYESVISNALEALVYRIRSEKEYNRMIDKAEVCVVEDIFSDTTALSAIENYEIENAIKNDCIYSDLFEDVDDPEEIKRLIYEWQLMKKEYELFCKSMDCLKKEEKEILLRYLNREGKVCELADEWFMEPETIAKKVQRAKKKMRENILPFWRK